MRSSSSRSSQGNPDEEDDSSWSIIEIAYLLTIVAPFIYFTVMHGRESGQTLGKRWVGIRVADATTGRSIGYGRAFGRYAISIVFGIFVIPALLDYLAALGRKEAVAPRQGCGQRRRQGLTSVVIRPVRVSIRRMLRPSNSLT